MPMGPCIATGTMMGTIIMAITTSIIMAKATMMVTGITITMVLIMIIITNISITITGRR